MEPASGLQVVSPGSHRALVQLLLEKNADVHLQGGEYGNALQAVSAGGHKGAVWLLLETVELPDWLEGHMHII